jgi:hypothetical protein
MEVRHLWAACRAGDVAAFEAAVGAGANINALHTLEGGCKQPPLFVAALNRHEDLLRLMVTRYGADLDARDSDGETVFGFLARYGLDEVAALLHGLKQHASFSPATQHVASQGQPSWTQLMARAVRDEAAADAQLMPESTALGGDVQGPASQQSRQAQLMLQDLCGQMQDLLAAKAEISRRREALQVVIVWFSEATHSFLVEGRRQY